MKLTRRQLEAIASPQRMEILEWMQSGRPCSIRELAARMGRNPSSLHYHVNRLREAGLLLVSGTRRSGARVEAILKPAAQEFAMDEAGVSGSTIQTVVQAAKAVLRRAGREFARAQTRNRESAPFAARMHARLSAYDIAQIRKHVKSLRSIFTKARKSSTSDPLYSLTLLISPIEIP